jgi:hypothetical protein
MTRSATHRLATALALAVSLTALLALLVTPALARKAASCSSSTKHAKHAVHACSQARHKSKSSGHRASKHHTAAHHTATHHTTTTGAKSTAPASAARTAPSCEDGSAPVRDATGVPTCGDGSEPACEPGSSATLSSAGVILLCTVAAEAESSEATVYSSEFDSSACTDGTNPTLGSDGSFDCADGSEPHCTEGSALALSGSGSTLVCEAADS